MGANSQAGWLYVIGAGFIGVVVAGMVIPAFVLKRITAIRTVIPLASVGDEIGVSVTLLNESRGRRGPLAGKDTLLSPRTFLVEGLAAGESSELAFQTGAHRRGAWDGADLQLETAAPFGVGRASRTLYLESPLVVHPRWVPIATFPLLESASTPNEALHERPRRGSGTDFYGLREYRPGDSIRTVHWPSTARTGNLLVKEYEQQIGSRMSILIDGSVLGAEPDTSFESSVSCAASLVMYGLDSGHPVQLFCPAGGGISHLFEPDKAQCLDWMARLEPDRATALGAMIEFASAEIYRRSTNVLIFPTAKQAAAQAEAAVALLQELGTRVIVVAVSARSFAPAGDILSESAEQDLLSMLTGRRAIVYLIERERDLAECLREPLPA